MIAPPRFDAQPARIAAASGLAPTLVGFSGRNLQSRAFNLLRTQLFRQASRGWRTVGITSAAPRTGKTFVASNLAASLSRIPGLATYLYDFDLRRGSVAGRFGMTPAQGLSDYLAGTVADLADIAWGIEDQALTVFPTIPGELESSELIAGERFTALTEAARAMTPLSLHLCDLPPVFANDDAMIACGRLDGYLLVVEDGVTTAKQLRDAIQLLGADKCFGTVLNRYIEDLGPGNYGFGYGGREAYGDYYG